MQPLAVENTPARASGRERGCLRATGLGVAFAGVKALQDVDIELRRGEILGLIGPNGSGKTTCLNVLSGFLDADGDVAMDDEPITTWPAARRARTGLARTFQAVRLFPQLTVAENVEAAALGTGHSRRIARQVSEEILDRMQLTALAGTYAAALPAGDERRVGIARAAVSNPRYMLLDEPAAGLNDAESQALVGVVRELSAQQGCGVLLVEHDMDVVMNSCGRIQVLDAGRTIALGSPDEVAKDATVIEAYFGKTG